MSEYIVDWDKNLVIDTFSKNSLREEIVRCRDCKNYLPYNGREITIGERIIVWDECASSKCRVEPDGFCAWAERRDA